MKEKDELTALFRDRLKESEMPVRDGFWEELSGDLLRMEDGTASGKRRSLPVVYYRRLAVAASAALLLGVASAAWWFLVPRVEEEPVVAQVAATVPQGRLDGDRIQELFPVEENGSPDACLSRQASSDEAPVSDAEEGEEAAFSVRLSVTITQHVYGVRRQSGGSRSELWNGWRNGPFYNPLYALRKTAAGQGQGDIRRTEEETVSVPETSSGTASGTHTVTESGTPVRKWALKAGVGTSLPKGDYAMPLSVGLTAEHRLNRCLSLEAGLQYGYMPAASQAGGDAHALAVPARLNLLLAETPRVDVYAQVGGAAEKTVGKGSGDDPVRLSVMAGLGVRYKLNERLALFAEPSVSRHFATDSDRRTLHSERPVNLNLLCGVRMSY